MFLLSACYDDGGVIQVSAVGVQSWVTPEIQRSGLFAFALS
ncbi:MAG: hypothetical protein M0Z96_02745 [Actinomycetota bacterium]|nr:hypothetical protein [Actinomycetota bacterium]